MKNLLRKAFQLGQQWVQDISNDISPINFNEWYDSEETQDKLKKILVNNNISDIQDDLSCTIKSPESIRKIEYCYKTKDVNPKYFVVDYPAHNYRYNNHRFFVIENEIIKEFTIKEFARYRDGGTTIITVIDEKEIEHTFFSPSPFSKHLFEKWDETELEVATESEKCKLIELLKLDFEPNN